MNSIRSLAKAGVLVGLVTAMGFPRFAAADSSRKGQMSLAQATKRTLLFFPVDVAGSNVPGAAEVSALLSDVAKSRFIASDAYTVVTFHKSLGPVARLHNDQQLSDTDVAPPFAEDNAKAIKIAQKVGYDLAFVGSVDDYTFADADKKATMTVSGRLLDVSTGRILKSATLSDSAVGTGTDKEPDVALKAARSAGDKLMSQIVSVTSVVKEPPVTPNMKKTPPVSPKKRSNNQGLLLGLLAVAIGLGIGLAAGGGGGGGGGAGGSDLPPGPPHP